jgi:hypothetical protein
MIFTMTPYDSSSSNRAVLEDEPYVLYSSPSRKACFEDEAGLMGGNSYLCEPSDDETL